VSVLNRQRARRIDTARLRSFLERLAKAYPPPGPAVEFAVCLISDRRMRALNREFRGIDRTTDVLSFPAGPAAGPEGDRVLGDVAVSVPTAERQAHAAGHSLERELRILALHGYLHLLGHDHERDNGQMRRIERRLRGRLLAPRAAKGSRGAA